MTNKEAIKYLQQLCPVAYSPTGEQRLEAINMAISALTTTQKEPACIYNRTPEERKVSCRYCSATCKARVEETASEDLEDAAEKYVQEAYSNPVDRNVGKADFIIGAQWQRQNMVESLRTEYEKGRYDMRKEMMKDAVNGQVVESANAVSDSKDVIDRYFSCVCSFREHQYLPTARDKVKLIIVKED